MECSICKGDFASSRPEDPDWSQICPDCCYDDVPSEIEQVAKSASSNEEISEKVKLSIAASRQGRVVSRQKAIERLKKKESE